MYLSEISPQISFFLSSILAFFLLKQSNNQTNKQTNYKSTYETFTGTDHTLRWRDIYKCHLSGFLFWQTLFDDIFLYPECRRVYGTHHCDPNPIQPYTTPQMHHYHSTLFKPSILSVIDDILDSILTPGNQFSPFVRFLPLLPDMFKYKATVASVSQKTPIYLHRSRFDKRTNFLCVHCESNRLKVTWEIFPLIVRRILTLWFNNILELVMITWIYIHINNNHI